MSLNKKSPPATTKGLVRNSKYLNYTSSLTDKQQISALLSDNIYAVLQRLFCDTPIHQKGDDFRIGNKASLAVKKQNNGVVFYSHESCKGGDVFSLIQYALSCDFTSAIAWSKGFLGLSEHEPWPKPKPMRPKPIIDDGKKCGNALRIWKQSTSLDNTYAELYLRNRGITIKLPEYLRFLPALWNFTAQTNYPALVAPVQDVNGKVIGIHTISIDLFTGRKITGERIQAKLSKGSIKGGAVRLSPDDMEVWITEGLEDASSLLQLNPSLCVWAGLGGNIRNVEFPPEVSKVTIASDNDTAGKTNATKLYNRLKREGREVSIIYPPEGFKDFNAYLMGGE